MSDSPPDSRFERLPRRGARAIVRYLVSGVLLTASVALLARTVYLGTRHEPVRPTPATKPFSDTVERDRRRHDFVGTFATGSEPGDRVLIVTGDGRVQFHPVGPLQSALTSSDSYTIVQRDRRACLLTQHSGVIDSVDIDHVSYFDDVYERTK